jgi:ribosomal protein L37E
MPPPSDGNRYAEAMSHLEQAIVIINGSKLGDHDKLGILRSAGLATVLLRQAAGEYRTCRRCGAAFHWTPEEQQGHFERGWSAPAYCGECRTQRRTERTCRRCGAAFIWNAAEQRQFQAYDYLPPTHCVECRVQKRAERARAGYPAWPREHP